MMSQLLLLKYRIYYDMARSKKTLKPLNYKISLDGSEHREVTLTLDPPHKSTDHYGRLATLTFPSDGMDVRIFLMEKDCRTLANFLLDYTEDWEK